MGGLAVTSVVFALVHKRIANRSLWPVFGSIAMVFVLHLLAGIHTQAANMDEYRFDLGLQLPFLMLPLAFWLLPPLPSRYLRWLWGTLIGMTVLAAIGATANYLLHAAAINESYMHSKVMPTEPDHIRFSLLITMAIAAAVLLLVHQAVPERLPLRGLFCSCIYWRFVVAK